MIRVDYAYRANRAPFCWRRAAFTVAGKFWSLYTVACVLAVLVMYSWCVTRPFSAGCLP